MKKVLNVANESRFCVSQKKTADNSKQILRELYHDDYMIFIDGLTGNLLTSIFILTDILLSIIILLRFFS